MVCKIITAAREGLFCRQVEVETDLARGLANFTIVGLPDSAINESRERIRAAFKNSELEFPHGRTTVNLAPSSLRKEGSSFDLPIAISILSHEEQYDQNRLTQAIFLGELSLDGTLRPIKGALSYAEFASQQGFKMIILPEANAHEAALISGVSVYAFTHLVAVHQWLSGKLSVEPVPPVKLSEILTSSKKKYPDFGEIRGQEQAKRALTIAAAGRHNVLLSGPPGAGKTMMAKAFLSILPPLSEQELLAVTRLYSIAGKLPNNDYIRVRPCRTVHHSASMVSIVGGGHHLNPGEISLGHTGVVLFDELPEFSTSVLESLRQPLEDREITVSRASGSITYPADFILVGTMNPCHCGYYLVPGARICTCSPIEIRRYQRKLSGPILDRIDLFVGVQAVTVEELTNYQKGAPLSSVMAQQVLQAREIQKQRFAREGYFNGNMTSSEVEAYCPMDPAVRSWLKSALIRLNLSARVFYRVLKLARTIADLMAEPKIKIEHLAEALQYRKKETL